MATLTEMVAALVVHSSAAALSHFGVTLEVPQAAPPAAEQRVVARSPRQVVRAATVRVEKATICPEEAKARLVKA